jgi:Family of unknown function (DUF6225)
MRCAEHGTDGCNSCKPAMHAAWTVGQLKAALVRVPDDTPLKVNVADLVDPGVADEQVVVGAGFGTVNWGDGYGPEADTNFALDCEWPEELLYTKPDRPSPSPSPGGIPAPSLLTGNRQADADR